MPLGKPTPDGEIISGSRHYSGRTLGEATIWKCPACGVQNEGRRPEQGCGHCGAGDPTKQQAGTVERPRGVEAEMGRSSDSLPVSAQQKRQGDVEPHPTPIRVLRLIEYIFPAGTDIAEILRRSLVGRIEIGMVAITATIVDTTDMQQEDRLAMARRQPGVWLAKPEAMNAYTPYRSGTNDSGPGGMEETVRHLSIPHFNAPLLKRTAMEMPDTGPAFNHSDAQFAKMIEETYGFRLCNTLALALGNLAEELRGNTEPEKFLSTEECLSLANALMQEIPAEWQGDGEAASPPAPTESPEEWARRQEIKARLGAKPEPVYKELPNADQ